MCCGQGRSIRCCRGVAEGKGAVLALDGARLSAKKQYTVCRIRIAVEKEGEWGLLAAGK